MLPYAFAYTSPSPQPVLYCTDQLYILYGLMQQCKRADDCPKHLPGFTVILLTVDSIKGVKYKDYHTAEIIQRRLTL